MFEELVKELIGVSPADIMSMMRAILNLIEQLIGNHNWMSNTQLAVFAEAQGAEFVRSNAQTANHAEALRQAISALANSEDKIADLVAPVARANPTAGSIIRDVLRPLFDLSRSIRETGQNTLARAADVAKMYPNRLSGVPFQTGLRGRASSVIQQLNGQAAALKARGVDPTLVPKAAGPIEQAIEDAEELPADEKEALAMKVAPMIVTIRQMIAIAIRNATGPLRATLTRILGPLEEMLAVISRAAAALIEMGSTFITLPIFIIPTQELQRMFETSGLRHDDIA